MRQVREIGALNHAALGFGQGAQRLGQLCGFLLQGQRIFLVGLGFRPPGQVFGIGALVAPQHVDAPVPRDRENPCCGRRAPLVELPGLAPDSHHYILRTFFSTGGIRPRFHEVGFHARPKNGAKSAAKASLSCASATRRKSAAQSGVVSLLTRFNPFPVAENSHVCRTISAKAGACRDAIAGWKLSNIPDIRYNAHSRIKKYAPR